MSNIFNGGNAKTVFVSGSGDTVQQLAAGPLEVLSFHALNSNSDVLFLIFWDCLARDVNTSTTPKAGVYLIPAGGSGDYGGIIEECIFPLPFYQSCSYCISTSPTSVSGSDTACITFCYRGADQRITTIYPNGGLLGTGNGVDDFVKWAPEGLWAGGLAVPE